MKYIQVSPLDSSQTPLFPFPFQNVIFSFFFVNTSKLSAAQSQLCALTSYLFYISLFPKKKQVNESQFKCCCYASSEDSKNEFEAIAKDCQISRVRGKTLPFCLSWHTTGFSCKAVCIYIPNLNTFLHKFYFNHWNTKPPNTQFISSFKIILKCSWFCSNHSSISN